MKILSQTPENHSIKRFKERAAERLGEIVWIEEDQDFSDVEWEEYNDDGDLGVNKSWLHRQLDRLAKYHFNTIDLYYCFIYAKDWEADGIYGWHLGKDYRDTRICLVRNRNEYYKTAEHELMHAVWSYVFMHTGLRLQDILGVSESGAVHGDAEGYEEYDYDELWEDIKPYYQKARGEDLADEYRSTAKRAVRLAKKLIRQLTYGIKK